MYQAYLVGVPDADNRTLVESLIAESTAQAAAAEKADAERARLTAEQKTAEQARLAAEAARQTSEANAHAEVERRKQVEAKLEAERQRELEQRYDRHPARPWVLGTGIAGLVTVGIGGYFAVRMKSRQSSFDDSACGDPGQIHSDDELADCRADIDRGKKDARLANVLIGAGSAVALGSLVVYLIDPGNVERPQRSAKLLVTPTSVGFQVRW